MLFKTFSDAENYLLDLQFSGIKLGLDQVKRLFREVGNPDRHLKFIHLAGTNGKGSTGSMIASALSSAGCSVGFYTSPHLFSIRERFRIDGKAISEQQFLEAVEKLSVGIEKMKADGASPTFFEATTVLAALCFDLSCVDFVVWETGLGGRFDATNVVDPLCSVLTGIALDHQEYLGDTLEKIAFEKGGIIKHNRPVFAGRVESGVAEVFEELAKQQSTKISFSALRENVSVEQVVRDGVPLQHVQWGESAILLSLLGPVQVDNALLAFSVVQFVCSEFNYDLDAAVKGFAQVTWPGRFQILGDGTIVDGAHNADGAQVLVDSLRSSFPDDSFTVIFGNFADKDSNAILETIAPAADLFIFVPIRSGRETCPPQELQAMLGSHCDVPSVCCSDVVMAVEQARQSSNRIVIAGSLYLAGEILASHLFRENILDIY